MRTHDVVILGAGPAGLAAAAELRRLGVDDIVVIDREQEAGGIPRHCGHTGYGLLQFGRLMTGPEFARRTVAAAGGVDLRTGHTALRLEPNGVMRVTGTDGVVSLQGRRVLLAMGARETPRSARLVSGTRPWGVMNTGALQQFVYLHGKPPFSHPVVVGTELVAFSTLLTLRHAGLKPQAMIEERDRITAWRPGGLVARFGFGVPVLTGCRGLRILGKERVEGVAFEQEGRVLEISCDGVVFTGGFRPESALLAQSHLEIDPGTRGPVIDQFYRCSDAAYFAAGNLLRGIETAGQCHREGKAAARAIFASLNDGLPSPASPIRILAGGALRYVYPQRLSGPPPFERPLLFKARAGVAVRGMLHVVADGTEIWSRSVNVLPERRISWRVPARDLGACRQILVELRHRG